MKRPFFAGLVLMSQKAPSRRAGRPELYFRHRSEWRDWLLEHHASVPSASGVHLIFYRVGSKQPSMRWEEAVQEALCFGWIDSTVKKIDDEKRRQIFCPRKKKSTWSKVNKQHIESLEQDGLMHASGRAKIEAAKEDGSWTSLDDVEEGIIPDDLQKAFEANPKAKIHFDSFSRGYRKSYLYWLNQAKREATRQNRIEEIIQCCAANKKQRDK